MRTALLTLFALLFFGVAAAQLVTPLVAFVEEGNLYLWQDGTRHALRDTGDVGRVWFSPDGTQIAFIQNDGWVYDPEFPDFEVADYAYRSTSLWIMSVDGEDLRQLVDVDDYRGDFDYGQSVLIHKLAWVPGTSLIAFNTLVQSEVAGYADTFANLYTVDTEIGDRVLAHHSDDNGVFAISPDGQHAAITTSTAISIIGLDGEMVLPDVYTFEESPDTPHNYYYPQMRWAADGESLLAVDLTSRVGWSETDDSGKRVHPAVDVVQIHMDGTTEVLASEQREGFNTWTLGFDPDGAQAVYSTGGDEDCDFAAFTLAEDVQLAPDSRNAVLCHARDGSAFVAFTPDGDSYRLEPRAGGAVLSRACEDFSACEAVQEIDGALRSFDFINETQFIYRIVANESGVINSYTYDLYYGALGEPPQHIGSLPLEYPDDLFAVSHN
jgi:Tol biopolymer transport system component